MSSRVVVSVGLVALVLAGAACGRDAASSVSVPVAEPDVTTTGPSSDPDERHLPTPPDIVVSRGDIEVRLSPTTYCWTPPDDESGICVDGVDPDPLPELAGQGPIVVEFDAASFRFTATVDGGAVTNDDGTVAGVLLQATTVDGVTTFDAPESTPAVVRLFGAGDEGDVAVAVRLT